MSKQINKEYKLDAIKGYIWHHWHYRVEIWINEDDTVPFASRSYEALHVYAEF